LSGEATSRPLDPADITDEGRRGSAGVFGSGGSAFCDDHRGFLTKGTKSHDGHEGLGLRRFVVRT
jgi:hypothetical protein